MGKVIFALSRPNASYEGLSDTEKRLFDWAKGRPPDVRIVFATVDSEDGSFDTATLHIERRLLSGQWAAFCLEMPLREPAWPEVWDHLEQLARAGLERTISESLWYRADDMPRSWDEDRNSALSN